MEGITNSVAEMLLGLGLPGLIILALGFAVWKLYNRNQELHSTLYEIGKDSVKSNEAAAAALNRLSDLLVRGRVPE